jgi:hypothetical protein
VAAVNWAIDVSIDGDSYPAARGDLGQRTIAVTYVPKIKAANQTPAGDPTLDPIEYTTFHRGAGASRSVGVDGMVAWGENIWTCDPGILLPGPEVTATTLTGATASPRPDGTAEADGDLFVVSGRYVIRYIAGQAVAPAPTQDLDLGAGNVGKSIKRFGSSLILTSVNASGVGLNLYERPDGGAWTNVSLGATPVTPTGAMGTVFWTTGAAGAQVTSNRLVVQFGPRTIRYCAGAPRLDISWTPGLSQPAIDVGGVITRLVATLDHLYIACQDGLRDLDASGLAPNLIPEAEVGPMPTGGLAAIAKGGFVYASAGYDLHQVTVSGGTSYAQGEALTPMQLLPNETPVGGYGTDIVARGRFLIYSMYDPILDTTWVMWGREPDTGALVGRMPGEASGTAQVRGPELGPYVWNVAPIVLHGFHVTSLHISSLAADGPRLWMFGQTLAGAVSGKWAPLAFSTPYGDLKSGRARRFAQSCFLVLPAEDGGDDAMRKDIEEVLQMSEGLTAGNSIVISAAKEGESTFATLGTFTSGPQALQPVSSAFVTARPTFKITMTGTPLAPPVSRRLSVRWLPNPDVREVRKYVLNLGRDERYGSGNRSARDADEQARKLVNLASASARVTFIDEVGNPLVARILTIAGPAEVEAEEGDSRVLSVAVTLSIFGAAPGPPFGYDAGIPWDSGRSWS